MNRCVLKKYWRLNALPGQFVRYVSQNHYEVLGLKNDASQEEIKTAYKQLCKKLHPDVNRDDPKTHDKFIQLKEAYTVLGKDMTRKEYDRELISRQHYARRINEYKHYDIRWGQGSESKEDYTHPYYDEVIWNRRHHPEKYSRHFDKSGTQKNIFSNWSISSLVIGGIILNVLIFIASGRSLTNQLDERDKKAAKTWREVQQKRIRLAQEEKLKAEGEEISMNSS